MSTAVHISLEEYLNTDYEPDCDYVDGAIEERNVGKNRHSRTQGLLTIWLGSREKEHGYKVMVEQRVKVSRSRVRIPDICLVDVQEVSLRSLLKATVGAIDGESQLKQVRQRWRRA
jgi:hypothetical protein